MTRKTLALFLTVALPLASAWACDPAATRPAGGGGPRQGGFGGPGGRGGRGGPFMQFDDETWARAEAFWRENTETRWAAFQAMDDAKKERVRPLIVHKYRSWTWERNPEIKAIKLKQVQAEDVIFRVKFDLDKLAPDDPNVPKLRKELKDAVEAVVGLELDERQRQLDDLEKSLREQRQDLKDRLARKAETVDERYEKFLHASMSAVPGDGGPRRPDGHRNKDDKREDKKDERKPQ